MKRLFPFFLCMILTLTGCAAHLSNYESNQTVRAAHITDADTKSYLILGDSIAAHFGVSDEESYEYKLAAKLREGGETWIGDNWGVSGSTSGDLVTLLDKSVEDTEKRRVLENADLICISIGGNNILHFLRSHGFSDFPPEGVSGWMSLIRAFADGTEEMAQEYLADLEVIIKEIRRVNPAAVILVQNIHNVARDVGGEVTILGTPRRVTDLTEPFLRPLVNTIASHAERLGYHVADTYSAFRDSEETQLLRREMIHPNEKGHTLIAEVLYNTYLRAQAREKTM